MTSRFFSYWERQIRHLREQEISVSTIKTHHCIRLKGHLGSCNRGIPFTLNISSTLFIRLKRMLARESSLVPTACGLGIPQMNGTSNTNLVVAKRSSNEIYLMYAGSIPAIQTLVAQWVEQRTINSSVAGSSPAYQPITLDIARKRVLASGKFPR